MMYDLVCDDGDLPGGTNRMETEQPPRRGDFLRIRDVWYSVTDVQGQTLTVIQEDPA